MAPTLITLHKIATGFGIELSSLLEGLSEGNDRSALMQLLDYMQQRSSDDAVLLLRVAVAMFASPKEADEQSGIEGGETAAAGG